MDTNNGRHIYSLYSGQWFTSHAPSIICTRVVYINLCHHSHFGRYLCLRMESLKSNFNDIRNELNGHNIRSELPSQRCVSIVQAVLTTASRSFFYLRVCSCMYVHECTYGNQHLCHPPVKHASPTAVSKLRKCSWLHYSPL